VRSSGRGFLCVLRGRPKRISFRAAYGCEQYASFVPASRANVSYVAAETDFEICGRRRAGAARDATGGVRPRAVSVARRGRLSCIVRGKFAESNGGARDRNYRDSTTVEFV